MCGGKLEYLVAGTEFTCYHCGRREIGHVHCSNGHYTCDYCHGKKSFQIILLLSLSAKRTDPIAIAEEILKAAPVPMLGCDHAWIAAGSLMAAIKNRAPFKVTDLQIVEALNRTRKQAIGAFCGLTGVCGIATAVGAVFSVLLGAACPKDEETAATMRVVSRVIGSIAAETGPCCCKNFLRTALTLSKQLVKEHFGVDLPCRLQVTCRDGQRHPHGCREDKCRYFPGRATG